MTTAPNPFCAPGCSLGGGDLSATLLRLRAVGTEVARRRLWAVQHQARRAAPRPLRSRAATIAGAALLGLTLAAALALAYAA